MILSGISVGRGSRADMIAMSMRATLGQTVNGIMLASCLLLMVASPFARGADADCKAVQAAVALQSHTPFHATVASSSTSKTDMIWTNNTLYMSMGGRWVGSPMPPERALVGVTGGNLPFSDCKPLPNVTISGRPAAVYSAKMQSGESVRLFISSGGQLLRETLNVQGIAVTVDFDYTNVRAPALGK